MHHRLTPFGTDALYKSDVQNVDRRIIDYWFGPPGFPIVVR